MLGLVLILVLVSRGYGFGRLVGGVEAEIENHNYQVAIELKQRNVCSGALVKPNVVLTTAFCVDGFLEYGHIPLTTVRAGSSKLLEGGEVLHIRNIFIDPRFDPQFSDYDIAVIPLKGSFNLSKHIGTIELANRGGPIIPGTFGDVTGWGATFEGGPQSEHLRVITIPNIDWFICSNMLPYGDLKERLSCWQPEDYEKAACIGDSGALLVIYEERGRPKLAGLVSWRPVCAKAAKGRRFPGIYTDISNIEVHDYITATWNLS